MPPKARITRDMIIDAAVKVVSRTEDEEINVRKVATELGCSTQPVMYHFRTVEDLKSEVFLVARTMHHDYILDLKPDQDDSEGNTDMYSVAERYVSFAGENGSLFKFIFQSGRLAGDYFTVMLGSASGKFLEQILKAGGLTKEQGEQALISISAFLHGYASLVANGYETYKEDKAKKLIKSAIDGTIAYWSSNRAV